MLSYSGFPGTHHQFNFVLYQCWYLIKVYRKQENFDMLEFKGDEKMAQKFLDFYQKDIAGYFPEFIAAALQHNLNFVVTRTL